MFKLPGKAALFPQSPKKAPELDRSRQELVAVPAVKAPLTVLSGEKPKPSLVKQLLALIAEHIIKSGEGKDKNLYLLANNSRFGKDQQSGISERSAG